MAYEGQAHEPKGIGIFLVRKACYVVKALARWSSVNIASLGNKIVLPLVQKFIELKAHSIISTPMCRVLFESL